MGRHDPVLRLGPTEVLYNPFGTTPEVIVTETRRPLAIQPETATV